MLQVPAHIVALAKASSFNHVEFEDVLFIKFKPRYAPFSGSDVCSTTGCITDAYSLLFTTSSKMISWHCKCHHLSRRVWHPSYGSHANFLLVDITILIRCHSHLCDTTTVLAFVCIDLKASKKLHQASIEQIHLWMRSRPAAPVRNGPRQLGYNELVTEAVTWSFIQLPAEIEYYPKAPCWSTVRAPATIIRGEVCCKILCKETNGLWILQP